MSAPFTAWWRGSPRVIDGPSTGTFAAWWRGSPLLHIGSTGPSVASASIAFPIEVNRAARSSHASSPIEYRPENLFAVASSMVALPIDVRLGIRSPQAVLLPLEWHTRLDGSRIPFRLETRLRVMSGHAALSIEIVGPNPFELLLAWDEHRALDQALFLVWHETALGLDQVFVLEWIEKDLLGALDLTWRELPAGMTDLLGQVQRPYGRATKTPNP